MLGSLQSGSIGMQGHVANGLTALFIACGQDVACIAEAAVGLTRFDVTDAGDLPLIGRVRVGDAHVRYRDADPRVRLDVSGIALTATDRQGQESLIFSGDGSLRGARFTIAGQGEGLGTLREPDAPFSLVFSAKNGATQMWFDGEVVPASPENVRGFLKSYARCLGLDPDRVARSYMRRYEERVTKRKRGLFSRRHP